MVVSFTNWISRFRWLVVLLSLAVAAVAGYGMTNFSIANDYRVYFDDDFPPLLAVEDIEDTYTRNDNVLFVLTAKEGELFTRENLAAVEWLTAESWNMPYSTRVDSISNFQYTYAEGDDLIVEDMIADAENLSDAELAQIRQHVLDEPRLADYLISHDKPITGVNITIHMPGDNRIKEIEEIIAYTNELQAKTSQEFPQLEVRLSGVTVMNSYFSTVARDDTSVIMPLLFASIIFGLWFFLRSFSAMFASLVIIVLSIVTAMGIAGWAGMKLTPPSMGAPLMILTLAVAHCVHILVTYLSEMRKQGGGKGYRARAAAESMRVNFAPVLITSFTTLLGFLSMNFSEAPPFRDQGNTVAVGVFFSWLFSVTTLPALMQIMPLRARKLDQGESSVMVRFADFVIARRTPLTWIMIVAVMGISAFALNNRLDDTYAHYFDETIQFRLDADYTDANLTGIFPLNFSFTMEDGSSITDPKFLGFIERYSEWLRAQPEVGYVSTISDTMKQLNQSMHGDDESWYALPENRELAAQYLLMYEMSLPYGLDLNNQISIDKSATRVFANMHISSTSMVLDFKARSEAWLAENMPEWVSVKVGAPPYMFARLGKVNVQSMMLGSGLALVGISIILIMALRSFRIGMISLIPNLVPAMMAFGVWGLLVGRVGLSLAMVLGMTMGIVVDDTVHLLSKYLRARREQGLSPEDSLRYAFSTVGKSLWITSVVLVVGFGMFFISHFEPNASMGIMSAITIALALVADFLLLPVLILLVDKDREGKQPEVTASADELEEAIATS